MASYTFLTFIPQNPPVAVTNNIEYNKGNNKNGEDTMSYSRTPPSNRYTLKDDINFRSWQLIEQESTSIHEFYSCGLNESCEQLLVARKVKQQQQSNRRSYGIGGAGNIRMILQLRFLVKLSIPF